MKPIMKPVAKTEKSVSCLGLLLLILSFSVQAQSPVWKIEKNDKVIFIGGSFHMLTPEDYPLPRAFEDAYQQSAQIVFETDIQKAQSPEYQQTMMRQLSYNDGRNLRQVLNEDTYLGVAEFFTDRGIPMAAIVNFKPGMVAMTMTVVELQRLGLVGVGVDAYYNEKSINDQKKLGQLESVEDQLEFISRMGEGREDEMLSYTMTDIAAIPGMWKLMKDAWRNGDMSKLRDIGISPLKSDFPALYQSIIVDRNNAWMPQIEAFLKTGGVEFVLVGALHLAGDDGLLAQLASRGYKIQQLP